MTDLWRLTCAKRGKQFKRQICRGLNTSLKYLDFLEKVRYTKYCTPIAEMTAQIPVRIEDKMPSRSGRNRGDVRRDWFRNGAVNNLSKWIVAKVVGVKSVMGRFPHRRSVKLSRGLGEAEGPTRPRQVNPPSPQPGTSPLPVLVLGRYVISGDLEPGTIKFIITPLSRPRDRYGRDQSWS